MNETSSGGTAPSVLTDGGITPDNPNDPFFLRVAVGLLLDMIPNLGAEQVWRDEWRIEQVSGDSEESLTAMHGEGRLGLVDMILASQLKTSLSRWLIQGSRVI